MICVENVGGGAEAGVEIAKTATGGAVAAAAEVAIATDTDDATDSSPDPFVITSL